MSKPRVVIRAFTCRRDVASATLTAKLLEQEGCEVLVASTRDFDRTVKLWKPEIAVVNARGYPTRVKEIAPDTKVVLIDGEGVQPPRYSINSYLKKHKEILELVDLCLVWGRGVYGEISNDAPELAEKKLHIVGNPGLDLIKFMPQHVKTGADTKSIGVVTRFHNLNDHEGRSSLMMLANEGNLEHTIQQCHAFVGVIRAMKILLEHTDFQLNIRPHPREQIDSYFAFKKYWFGAEHEHRIKIDTSLSFAHWAVKNRALISPTSTSFLEAYLLKIPVINIEYFCKTDGNQKEGIVGKNIRAASLLPKTDKELIDLVKSDFATVPKNDVIEKKLDEDCDYHNEQSACYRAAKLIAKLAHDTNKPGGFRLPTKVIDVIDEISFRRACKHNSYHPNMNYRRGYHALPPSMDEMVRDIVRSG